MERTYAAQVRGADEIKVCGFVENIRNKSKMAFIVLKDITGKVQITVEKGEDEALDNAVNQITLDSVITVIGKAVESEYVKLGGVEIYPKQIIIESLASLTPHAVEMSVDMPMPVRIAYTTPRTLGLDRVAAAIGAYSLCKANRDILVIDIGTAITYDIVSADGIYRGGNIAPGVDMRLRALNHFTARLPLVTIDDTTDVPQWGTDTVSALRAGALEGVVGEILHYRNNAGAGAHIVVTGGQAPLILRHLPFQPITHPHLVSLGLYTILRYNFEQ